MCPSPIRESLRSFVAAVRSSRPGKWGGHRDELPASHSITSSARASSVGGIPPCGRIRRWGASVTGP
jgi:hypothetical protein